MNRLLSPSLLTSLTRVAQNSPLQSLHGARTLATEASNADKTLMRNIGISAHIDSGKVRDDGADDSKKERAA